MDNLPGLIAIAVIYLCIILRSDKKRRAGSKGESEAKTVPRRSGGRRRPEHKASFEQAFGSEDSSAGAGAKAAQPAVNAVRGPGGLAAAAAGTPFPEEDCEAHMPGLHLHTVTQKQMSTAGEGEDPCHAGSATRPAPGLATEAAEPSEGSAAARELLRGVILSEILERPCERRARLQHRRRM